VNLASSYGNWALHLLDCDCLSVHWTFAILSSFEDAYAWWSTCYLVMLVFTVCSRHWWLRWMRWSLFTLSESSFTSRTLTWCSSSRITIAKCRWSMQFRWTSWTMSRSGSSMLSSAWFSCCLSTRPSLFPFYYFSFFVKVQLRFAFSRGIHADWW